MDVFDPGGWAKGGAVREAPSSLTAVQPFSTPHVMNEFKNHASQTLLGLLALLLLIGAGGAA